MVNTNSFKSITTQRTYFIRPENLKCSSDNVVYFLHAKHAINNKQAVQRIFDQGLITIDVPIETFSKEKSEIRVI